MRNFVILIHSIGHRIEYLSGSSPLSLLRQDARGVQFIDGARFECGSAPPQTKQAACSGGDHARTSKRSQGCSIGAPYRWNPGKTQSTHLYTRMGQNVIKPKQSKGKSHHRGCHADPGSTCGAEAVSDRRWIATVRATPCPWRTSWEGPQSRRDERMATYVTTT